MRTFAPFRRALLTADRVHAQCARMYSTQTEHVVSETPEESKSDPDYVRLILLSRVYRAIKETPLDFAPQISTRAGATIKLKREDKLPFFSFKLRGAYNRIAHLTPEEKKHGVITASAGNHAQGVAYSSKVLNIPATIVMPLPTPAIKWENVRRLGAKVVLHGRSFDEAKAECARLSKLHNLTYIPPFDDPLVIAGQGTIGMEILRQADLEKLKAVFVPVGGGGLISGIAVYLKRMAPHVKVIGVETYDADAMRRSIAAGKRVTLKDVGLFSDGTAVGIVGEENFRLCQKYVDEIVLVNTDEICAAINDIYTDMRSITEPAGALGVAGAQKWLKLHPEAKGFENEFVAINSGANVNLDRLRFVSERSRLGAGREKFLIVEMPEKPGSFRKLVNLIAPRPVTEFSYRFNPKNQRARVYISFEVEDPSEMTGIADAIESSGMKCHDLSDNTLAKVHARYMMGGTPGLSDEHVYRFEFPERPGALHGFLQNMEMDWNVSLFHYRNSGSDIAHVLVGIQIPKDKEADLEKFLAKVGYRYHNENDNLAYKLCLK